MHSKFLLRAKQLFGVDKCPLQKIISLGVDKGPLQKNWSGNPVHSNFFGVNIFRTPKELKKVECTEFALQFSEKKLKALQVFTLGTPKYEVVRIGVGCTASNTPRMLKSNLSL